MTDKPDLAEIEATVQAARAQAETQKQQQQPAAASDTGSTATDGVGDVIVAALDGTLEMAGSVLVATGEAAASIVGGIFDGLGS